jgi:hypothetical protein
MGNHAYTRKGSHADRRMGSHADKGVCIVMLTRERGVMLRQVSGESYGQGDGEPCQQNMGNIRSRGKIMQAKNELLSF